MFVSASCRASVSYFRPMTSDRPGSGDSRLPFAEKLMQWVRNSLRISRGNLINPTKESEI